jgi:hypothetical protein
MNPARIRSARAAPAGRFPTEPHFAFAPVVRSPMEWQRPYARL